MNENAQKPLFPVEIIETYPSDQNTADLNIIGRGRNDKDYAIKTLSDGKGYIPASELFCYEIAKIIDIPTPEYDIVKLQNNELAFGSVWRGDANNISSQAEALGILDPKITSPEIYSVISKIYGLDLFINNIDRHFGNYLFSTSYKNRKTVLAFDFSRAWLEIDYSGFEVLLNTCKTFQISKILKNKNLLNIETTVSTLENIEKIPQETIEQVLKSLVSFNWIDTKQMNSILKWWGSNDFIARIVRLKKEAKT